MATLVSEPFNSYTASDPLGSLVTDVFTDIAVDVFGEQFLHEDMPTAERDSGDEIQQLRLANYEAASLYINNAPEMDWDFTVLTAPNVVRSGNIIGRIEPVAGQNLFASAA